MEKMSALVSKLCPSFELRGPRVRPLCTVATWRGSASIRTCQLEIIEAVTAELFLSKTNGMVDTPVYVESPTLSFE